MKKTSDACENSGCGLPSPVFVVLTASSCRRFARATPRRARAAASCPGAAIGDGWRQPRRQCELRFQRIELGRGPARALRPSLRDGKIYTLPGSYLAKSVGRGDALDHDNSARNAADHAQHLAPSVMTRCPVPSDPSNGPSRRLPRREGRDTRAVTQDPPPLCIGNSFARRLAFRTRGTHLRWR